MKYELTDETKDWCGITLHRIRALVDIAAIGVAAGDLGGWIETEANLSQTGNAWVYERAIVCQKAVIEGGTFWGGTFRGGTFWGGTFRGGTFAGGTFEGGTFEGGTFRGGTFRGGTFTCALTAQRSDGYVFTFNPAPNGPRIAAGCRYFTFDEAARHWGDGYRDAKLGAESRAILAHLRTMAELNGLMEPVA